MERTDHEPWVWWKHGVVYHIYIRSFYDTNHDGIGDIKGVIEKLEYLENLGVDAIWLSPIFTSPHFDFGYDISDYTSIDPSYGTIEDFEELIDKAHQNGIRIILDLVLNHTSEKHPWFVESCEAMDSPKRDWYIWKPGKESRPPNNWKSVTGGSAWTLHPATNQYYLHSFFPQQPDLNWRNEEVLRACFAFIQFWLEKGVDGFRLDVINLIVKDKHFRDNPQPIFLPNLQQHLYTRNRNRSYKIVQRLRSFVDLYEDRMLVGEIYVLPPGDAEIAASYLGHGDNSLHLAFDFSLIFKSWNAHKFYKSIVHWQKLVPQNGWPCHVLSNHDLFRSINRIPWRIHKLEKAKVAAVLMLTLKGTPFIYYGEEVGMKNSRIPRNKIRDPLGRKYWPFFAGRDMARTPMHWDNSPFGGFSDVEPWLPVDKSSKKINVQSSLQESESLFYIYKSLIRLRKEYPALMVGEWVGIYNGSNGVLGYSREGKNQRVIVLLNFRNTSREIVLQENIKTEVIFSTHNNQKEPVSLNKYTLAPFEATVFCELEHRKRTTFN